MTKRFLETKENIRELVADTVLKAEEVFNMTFPPFDLDLGLSGRCAGQAVYRVIFDHIDCVKLRFNLELAHEHWEEFKSTVAHEICHIVVAILYGRCKPHGQEWKLAMKLMGERPEIYHTMAPSERSLRQTRPFVYICGCKEHNISFQIQKKIVQQGRVRYCKKCGENLLFLYDMRYSKKPEFCFIVDRYKYVKEEPAIVDVKTPDPIKFEIPAPKPEIKKVANEVIKFNVKMICMETGFDAKKVRRILRKFENDLPKRSGKAWEFDMEDKDIVLSVF